MNLLVLTAALSGFFISAGPTRAQSPSAEPYNAKASPLDDLSRELLAETGYAIGEDGVVLDKIANVPVRRDEMAYLLSRLAGARRLKALIELNLILNRSEGEKRLTAAEREAVRKIVRSHWSVFGVGTRRDFRSYFSIEELETLDKIPPRFDRGSALMMRDPEPVTAAAAPPHVESAPAVVPMTEPKAAGTAPFYPRAVLTPFLEPLSLRRPSPFAPRLKPVIPASAAESLPPQVVRAQPAAAAAVSAPISPAIAAAPAAPALLENPRLGVLQPWAPPTESSATAAVSTSPNALPAPTTSTPPTPPTPADATEAEFDAFVANGPYSLEGRVLLKMLAGRAPDFCRALLRRTVVRGAPLIVFDGARTGADRRAGFAPTQPGAPPTIALSPGALLVERKSGLFGRTLIAVPEDPRAWAEIGVAAPALEAARKDAVPTGQEAGPWGATKLYRDKSRRGSYSTQQQAGELLERLLLLGLEREDYLHSTYAARAWARSARLLFSARVAEDYGNDAFLDFDRRLELRDWIERGDEADDRMVAAWSSSRGNVLDPRRGGPDEQARYERQARRECARPLLADHLAEAARGLAARVRALEALTESDLLSHAAAKSAAQKALAEEAAAKAALLAKPPSCEGRFGVEEEGLHRSAALLAEASRAERAFRERKAKGLEHVSR